MVNELKEIRRGRGLRADDLHERVGLALCTACGVTDLDHPALIRRKIILQLTKLSAKLPSDLHLAATVALGLHQDAAGEFLDQRIAWLANTYDRDPRTARRRVDNAFKMLAELLYDAGMRDRKSGSYSPDGWYVESLRGFLRMDLELPTLTEERRIVAAVDDLDELILSMSAPRDPRAGDEYAIRAEMVYGGEIVAEERVSSSHSRFVVRLPSPLTLGQTHNYSIQFISYPRQWMRPYYVFTPLRRCEEFSVRVRYGTHNAPAKVWRISGLPSKAYEDFVPGDDQLTVDRLGDVSLEFHDLQQGLSYGLQWQYDDEP
ncbi:hypothetical protein SAMN05216188_10957 [Lentzea xinjiangensis]|uniref:Uncharacterized protein n=2 Tax=Lentzea xinjiangensis TaxID=402600 RepID=A0A1H9MHC0_9PSEU|nr:hypothetical protein SAMN05216188_10957 [Lentzea xinjiangensis]